jgi:hypothetical protein
MTEGTVMRIKGRVVLNDAPLGVECDRCLADKGQPCPFVDSDPPGYPVRYCKGRVEAAKAAGIERTVDPETARAAMAGDLGQSTEETLGGMFPGLGKWVTGMLGGLMDRVQEKKESEEDKRGGSE